MYPSLSVDMNVIDTHAHLDDPHLLPQLEELLRRAREVGVRHVLAVGTTADSSDVCAQLAQRHPELSAAVGIQPNHVAEAQPGDWDRIVALANDAAVRAIGETGLDRYWDAAPFELQQDYFDRHLRLAQQRDLACVVHMRQCEREVVEMLQEARRRGPLRGVMHSYTGSWEAAAECLQLGLHISFAGMVTFKKDEALRGVAAQVPADRLLVETDSPYLSPEPLRGRRPNEPARVVHTLACLAAVRQVHLAQLADQTTRNAQQLFQFSATRFPE